MGSEIIDMQTHFDVDGAMEELAKRRYAMPPVVVAAFRQAAMKGAERLLELVSDDARFNKLRVGDQVKILELIFDRAYGKSETASTSMVAQAKVEGGVGSDHSAQLEQIAERAQKRRALSAPAEGADDGLPTTMFPELQRAKRAASRENVVALPRRPAI